MPLAGTLPTVTRTATASDTAAHAQVMTYRTGSSTVACGTAGTFNTACGCVAARVCTTAGQSDTASVGRLPCSVHMGHPPRRVMLDAASCTVAMCTVPSGAVAEVSVSTSNVNAASVLPSRSSGWNIANFTSSPVNTRDHILKLSIWPSGARKSMMGDVNKSNWPLIWPSNSVPPGIKGCAPLAEPTSMCHVPSMYTAAAVDRSHVRAMWCHWPSWITLESHSRHQSWHTSTSANSKW